MLQSMGSQRVGHDLVTEQQQQMNYKEKKLFFFFLVIPKAYKKEKLF